MGPLIRNLDPVADFDGVAGLYVAASDYWLLADWRPHGREKVVDFFSASPPGCDPLRSFRLGIFQDEVLAGVAELAFGFPAEGDAYLGEMILGRQARGRGLGRQFLIRVEDLARQRGARRLYLGVLEENPRGLAFWIREGFSQTGVSRWDAETGHRVFRLGKDL